MSLAVHPQTKDLMNDQEMKDLFNLQKIVFDLKEANYAESWNKIKDMGFMSQDRYESLIVLIIRANITSLSRKESIYLRFLIDLSKDIEIRKYLNYYCNINIKDIRLCFAKSLKGEPLHIKFSNNYFENEDSTLFPIIWHDDLKKLKSLMTNPEFQIFHKKIIELYIGRVESYSFLQMTCRYGAVKCFKYLYMLLKKENMMKDLESCKKCAIYGGNVEIIHLMEQSGIKYDQSSVLDAIESNNIEIFDWLVEKFPETLNSIEVHNKCIKSVFLHGIFQIDILNFSQAIGDIVTRDIYELIRFIIVEKDFFSEELFQNISFYGSERATKIMFQTHEAKCMSLYMKYLYDAVEKGNGAFIKCGIAAGFNPNVIVQGYSLLSLAVQYGDIDMIEAVVNHQDVEINDIHIIRTALRKKKLSALKLMLDKPGLNMKKLEEDFQALSEFDNYY